MKLTRFILFGLPLLASISASNQLLADDTEIFFSEEILSETEEFQPNVLFIFDSSGSMDEEILTQPPYDPDHDYGGLGDGTIYVHNEDYSYRNVSIDPGRNSCKAMTDHMADSPDLPVYAGKRVAEWHETTVEQCTGWWWWRTCETISVNYWRDVTNSNKTVECRDDAGVHGIDDSSSDRYARDGDNGPYSTSNQINWNQNGITDRRLYVSANYHEYLQANPSEYRRKLDIMKEAGTDLVSNFTGLNFGLMRFNYRNGGYVLHHFSDIEDDRDAIIDKIDDIPADDWTPLNETLWEAHRYFKGDSVDYGSAWNRDPAAVTRRNGTDYYNSPIGESSCQSNYVVLLTDGTPYEDNGRDSAVSNLTGNSCSHSDNAQTPNRTCLDEMAEYMANYDYNDALDGTQSVRTYTIAFDFGYEMELLKTTADKGKGQYLTASSSQQLKTAFNKIILDILSTSTTFTAPAVSVNAFNRLQHQDSLYFAIFEPNIYPRWHGNIKKYKINTDGDIVGSDDAIAINPDTGYFHSNAISYWSQSTDGNAVKKGGAANELTNSRLVYTVSGDASTNNIVLNSAENIIALDNDTITNELYGLSDDASQAARDKLIKWILGVDVNDDNDNGSTIDASRFMADALHNRPVVVTYSGDSEENTTEDVLFFTSNDGTFRAVDTGNGEELFAFIPQDQLQTQHATYINDPDASKIYGLDGPMTIWREENPDDDDITIDASDGDHVYSYFGMRRGGDNYYAMDITNTNNPKLLWTIFGGSAGFHDLGQTWSKPVRGRINWGCNGDGENCTTRDVLVFGGGYDTTHDAATTPTTGDMGAAIYMVDALTGQKLWSAGNNDTSEDIHNLNLPMSNSIPGDLTIADMNGDGIDDIIFGVDIQGSVWRIDINSATTSANNLAQGGKIANLAEAGEFRRFYVGPTVSLSQKKGRAPFFVLTFGSGYMAHPKNTAIDDRLYSIFEYSVYGPPKDEDGDVVYNSIDNDDLLDMTSPDSDPADPQTNAPNGFYKDAIDLGEKFMRPALTIDGTSIYTSYLPEGTGEVDTTCGAGYLGGGRLYAMNFVTGKTVLSSQYINLKQPGNPPEVVALFVPDEDGKTSIEFYVGTEKVTDTECEGEDCPEGLPTTVKIYRTYWRENQ
jgi:type IV pilus assembly protein PilY1